MVFASQRIFTIASTLLLTSTLQCAVAADLNEQLFAAVRKGDVAAVKTLLEKGADVNAKGPYEQTPLFFAADRGYFEIVNLLVEKGADINRKDSSQPACNRPRPTKNQRLRRLSGPRERNLVRQISRSTNPPWRDTRVRISEVEEEPSSKRSSSWPTAN